MAHGDTEFGAYFLVLQVNCTCAILMKGNMSVLAKLIISVIYLGYSILVLVLCDCPTDGTIKVAFRTMGCFITLF